MQYFKSSFWAGALAACISVPLSSLLFAQSLSNADMAVKEAADAFKAGDLQRVQAARALTRGHRLESYIDYWALRMQIDKVTDGEIRALLTAYPNTVVADRLRTDWLRELGRRGDWVGFAAQSEGFNTDDGDIACYRATLATRNERVNSPVVPAGIWAERLTDACAEALAAAAGRKWISAEDTLWRFRTSADGGTARAGERSNWALNVAQPGVAPSPDQLQRAHGNPETFLKNLSSANALQRPQREAALYAVTRLARSDASKARAAWLPVMGRFTEEEQRYAAGQIAYASARRLDTADALSWFKRTLDRDGNVTRMGDWQLAWVARAGLRAGAWTEVLRAVNAMSPAASGGQNDATWQFWKARALADQGDSQGANAIFAKLAPEPHFYGLLAAEVMGQALPSVATLNAGAVKPTAEELAAYERNAAAQRVLILSNLGLRAEAAREWYAIVRDLSDRDALIAAEWMRQKGIWDRSINTAELTKNTHDYGLRYQLPYATELKQAAQQNKLDNSLVFGLVRQESRFWAEAVSSAGALGLMQVMPATGKWLAGKMGVTDFRASQLTEVATNARYGAYYLRMVLDQMGGSEPMAAASYNAGPGRARGWRADVSLEGAIYAESIPFSETRDYVKKVLTNAVWYSQLTGEGSTSLRRRLGIIAAK